MNIVVIALISLSLSACSPLDAVSFLKPSSGVSADIQAGKTNEQTTGLSYKENQIDAEQVTTYKAQKFAQVTATELIYDESVPPWIWILVILGWILPSPIEIYKGLGNLIKNTIEVFKK